MRSSSDRRRHARSGFSLIEVLMAMSIVGILAGLAIPNLRTMTFRARAASVAGDIDVVRVAISQYNGDLNAWPAEAANGVVPPELTGYVPEGFSFQGEGFELDYEALSPVVIPGDPSTTQIIGVAVTADTDELSNAIVELLGGGIIFSTGRRHTFVIFRS